MQNPHTMSNKSQKFWDKQAKRYDSIEGQFDPVYEGILSKTASYLDPGDTVMDLGCASGSKTLALAGKVKHIHGLDLSGEMIREANKKKEARGISNCSFSRGTVFENEFERGTFDAVVSFGVLHLLKDREGAFRAIYDLLKPGGFFISATGIFKEKMARKERLNFYAFLLFKTLGIVPLHVNMFTTDGLIKLIEDQGFETVESEKIMHGMTILFLVAKK